MKFEEIKIKCKVLEDLNNAMNSYVDEFRLTYEDNPKEFKPIEQMRKQIEKLDKQLQPEFKAMKLREKNVERLKNGKTPVSTL